MMPSLIAPDGQALDLLPGTVISLNLKNPVFSTDVLEGSFSYAFNLPLTDRNRLRFGFPENISSLAGYTTEYPGYKLKFGLVEFQCKLILRKVVTGGISVNVYTASALLADVLKNTKLNDVPTEVFNITDIFWYGKYEFTVASSSSVGEIASATIVWNLPGPTVRKYRYGVKYTGSLLAMLNNLANKINTTTLIPTWSNTTTYQLDQLVLNTAGTMIYRSGDNGNVGHPVTDVDFWEYVCLKSEWNTLRAEEITPLWYEYDEFDYVKRERALVPDDYSIVLYDPLLGEGGYFDLNSFNDELDVTAAGSWTPAEYSAAGVNVWKENYSAVAMWVNQIVKEAGENPDFTFFPIHNPDFMPDQGFGGIMNYWRNGAFPYNRPDEGDPLGQVFSAQVNMGYALRKVMAFLNKEIVDEGVLSDPFLQTLYLLNNFSNDRFIRVIYGGRIVFIDPGANTFNLSENLPTISIAEFMNGLRGYFFFGIWFDASSSKVIFRRFKDLLSDYENAVDLSSQVVNLTDIEYTDPGGFFLQYSHDGGDSNIGSKLLDIYESQFTILDPVETIEDLPDPSENVLCLVKDIDTYYLGVLLYEGVFEWQYFSRNLHGLKIGNAKTTYQPKCSTVMMYNGHDFFRGPKYEIPFFSKGVDIQYREGDYVQDLDGNIFEALADNEDVPLTDTAKWSPRTLYKWQLPMISQPRRSVNHKEKSGCSLRVLSYKGIAANPLSTDPSDVYPQATNDRGTLGSLKWEGEYGIYEKYGKEWIRFLSKAKKSVATFPMTETLLQRLKPWRLVRIRNQYFVQGELKVSFPLDANLAELTLYSINVTP
jgi:hypothetical protein